MNAAAAKITSTAVHLQKKENKPFFSKSEDGSFFSKSNKFPQPFFSPFTIQTKLTIGQPNDKYEQEADVMADKVLQRLAIPDVNTKKEITVQAKPVAAAITHVVQTKCATCEQEEKLQKKEEDDKNLLTDKLQKKPIFESNAESSDDDKNIQRKCTECDKEEKLQKKSDSTPQSTSPDIESSLNSAKSSGSQLPHNTREQMESSFGVDFSGVRIHNDSSSVQMNKDLHAQAFTHGSDIYFNSGKYNSNNKDGRHLLAHELTHVVQQNHNLLADNIVPQTSSLISRAPELTKQEKADEKRVREKVKEGIALLNKTKAFVAPGGQEELLDEMLNTFNLITPDHIGIIYDSGSRIKLGQAVRLFYTFERPGAMGRPFEYRIRFDISHEAGGAAAGYFQMNGNYGGTIVIKVPAVKSASIESIAKLLVHESVHMFSHLQRTVKERIGNEEARLVPGEKAAAILDTSSFASYQKKFTAYFDAVRTFLNNQPRHHGKFNELPESVVADWTRKVVEETIAYVYQERIGIALDKVRTAGTKGAVINFTQGFNPIAFLKDYVTKHWLTDPDDQRAMATKEGVALLSAMSTDIEALHKAVDTQVGPDKA